ncbi:hypothetical protein [Vibrio europaeus]|uniref:hypothetical protein n=1 Tax=Vibrio europaeus TaxID=300876 RepID=UPI00233E8B9A|nr:hypothetical protein [Vibrio europaeus]MDC5822996.1 hypothetical protein [Vibrio europaeus]MDC5847798.1 hypothetical protein [Vibrio europaeus]MDC5854603.1 hypothetical protein [Vibrio europaeus]MDC5869628.1 hypothetical protein [Vibrio europaeus]
MKKSLIALVVASSFVLAGCSSSGGVEGGTESTPQRPAPVDPEWGIAPDDIPHRPEPIDPGFGIGTEIDRPQPDMGDTPDWGLDSPVDRPEPTDPNFGVQVPTQPPVDNEPERPNPDFGEDMPTWGGECGSPDGGANCAPIPPKPPVVDPEWGVNPDTEVSPAINNIDRNKVRDAVRTRLNG